MGIYIIVIIAFVLGYAAGWDGYKTHEEIEQRKAEHPNTWWKF
jgi:hypothetical protein